ncbi:MAG: class I SAM-dependent methyltransferase [Myxococcaceae bacterium]|nr:class I SAM-dependent methyltransferase [Myxococcaceae bacterium]
MGIFSVLKNVTNGYSPVESFAFDRFAENIAAPLHDFAMTRIAAMVRPSTRVLDVGCGGGQFALRLAGRFPSIRIVGLDNSPEQIARARSRGASLRDRVSFVEGTAIDLPFDEAEFDLVYSLGSIKHWPERERGLRECARVLTPGGRLWVLEGDRGCRLEDVHALVSTWNIPALLRPVATAFFRNVVAGQSLDLDEARALLTAIPSFEGSVERGAGLPVWLLAGSRAAPGA